MSIAIVGDVFVIDDNIVVKYFLFCSEAELMLPLVNGVIGILKIVINKIIITVVGETEE